MGTLEKIIAGTFTLIVIYLFVFNAEKSSQVITALGNVYMGSVRTLQGQKM